MMLSEMHCRYSAGQKTVAIKNATPSQYPFARLNGLFLHPHSGLSTYRNPGLFLVTCAILRCTNGRPIRYARVPRGTPLLLIHGEAESLIPVSEAHDPARDVGPSCSTMLLSGDDHAQAFNGNSSAHVEFIRILS